MGIGVLALENFVTTHIQSKVQTATVDVVSNLLSAVQEPGVNNVFASSLGNFLSHTGKAFFEKLSTLIGSEILTIEAFESLVSQCPVSLVVLGCDNSPTQRALVKAADKRKIPTLHLAHGIPTKSCYGVAGEMGELYADFLAAFGEIHLNRLTENAASRKRIFLTGSPLWDPLYREGILMSKEHACRELGLKPDCPVVLFCTSGTNGSSPHFPGKCRRLFDLHQNILQAVHEVGSEVQLLVRPHPNEIGRAYYSNEDLQWLDQAYRRWAVTRHKVHVQLIRDRKIESIRAADLVIAVPSNVVSEAMILQRPVMVIPLTSGEYGCVSEEHQKTQVIRDKIQIYPQLKELLDSPSKREEIVKQQNALMPDINFGHDGKSTERVVRLVEQLASPTHSESVESHRESGRYPHIKILLAVHNFPPHSSAGTELYTYNVAKALKARGHEVTVFYPIISDDIQPTTKVDIQSYEDISVARLPISQTQFRAISNQESKPTIREYLLEHPVDVVHVQHLLGLSTSFVEVLQELHIPIVLTANDFWFICEQIHLVDPSGVVCSGPETINKCVQCLVRHRGPFPEKHMPSLFRYFANRLDHCKEILEKIDLLLCPSEFLFKIFKRYGYTAKNMIHAPQGTHLFNPVEVLSPSQPPLVFSYLGHIANRKGFDIFIDALNHVDATNVEFRVYGLIVEPEYFASTMKKIRKGKKIIYCGTYSPEDLPHILSETHMAIIPSRGENYPFIIREVLHGGVPVIASAVAGIPEIIQDGVNGLLFKGGSVLELASKIDAIIQTPHLINEFKRNIHPIKSIEQEVIEFEKYYEAVISSKGTVQQIPATNTSQVHVDNCDGEIQGLKTPGENASDDTTVGKTFTTSIVIPVFNKVELTRQCLVHLAKVTDGVSYEIIIVDNNSTDGTKEFLDSLDGDVQIIRNNKNLGFGKACNQGARVARGKYFVFLNNDTIPHPGWLQTLVNEADSDPDVAIVGSKLLYTDNTVQHAGIVFNRKTGLPGHWASGVTKDSPLVSNRRQCKAVTAACMLVKREVFERVKGFDEAYINGYEDIDLCLKIERQNGKIIYQPESCLYHLESQTQGRQDHMDHNRDQFLSRWGNIWLEDQDVVAYEHGCAVVQVTLGQNKGARLVPMINEIERIQWCLVANVQERLRGSIREFLDQGERRDQLDAMLSKHDQWPLDPGVLEWGGYICDTLGFEQHACAFWHKLLKVEDHVDARRSLIRSAIRRGRLDEAQEHLDILERDGSFSIEDVILQGTLFLQREQYDKAKVLFQENLSKKPKNQKTRLGLGMALLGQGNARDAFEVFQAILKDYPDNQDALHWIVRAGYALKDWGGIAELLEHFLLRNPANCDIRFTLAGVYLQAKMREKFQKEYETLRLLKPDYEGLKDLEKSLSGSFSCTPVLTENEAGPYANQNDMSFSHSQAVSTYAEKRVSVLVSDTICGAVRLIMPLLSCIETLGVQGKVFNALENDHIKNTLPAGPKDVWLSHRTNVLDAETVKMARDKGTRIVHDIDDLIWNLPDDNPNASLVRRRSPRLRAYLPSIDCVTVATDPIKEYLARWDIESLVLPNCLFPKDWVPWPPQSRVGRRPRVGWAGQAGVHKSDLVLLNTIIEVIGDEVEWVFLGDAPEFLGHSHVPIQVYPMVAMEDFPRALADLHLDVALAPLAHNEFNEAKSDIRILQYGILGYSVIATDIYPHRQAPIERVPNDPAAWIRAIRERIHDVTGTQAEGASLREWVLDNRMIHNYLPQYQAAWFGSTAQSINETVVTSCEPGEAVIQRKKENDHQFTIDCSIVIPVFNKVELTQQCLIRLARVTEDVSYEILVVDNNSTDGTGELLKSLGGDVQVIRNNENLGFAKACNQGARATRGKYIVFLNNDTIPQDGWLSALVQEANLSDDSAVVGSKLLYPDNTIQHAGVAFSRDRGTPYHIYRGLSSNGEFVNQRREFQAVTAACMLVKRKWFEEANGFEECYRNGFEDADLCLKIRERGGKIIYQPKSWLYHLESQSQGRRTHDEHNSSIFEERWRKRNLVDEDSITIQDQIALVVEKKHDRVTINYKKIHDDKVYVQWEKIALLQRLLHQLNAEQLNPCGRKLLLDKMKELIRFSNEWPDDQAVSVWVASTCYAFEYFEESEMFFQRALRGGESLKARAMLARFSLNRRNLEDAGRHLHILLNANPYDPASWNLQGVYFMQYEKYSEAVEAFQKALLYEGDRKKAQLGIGMAYVGMGETEHAWDVLSKATTENPDDVELMNWVLRTGTELADWASLSTVLSRFVERNPTNADMRFALAGVQVRQGNTREARSHLHTLQLLNPEYSGIQDLEHAIEVMGSNFSTVANSETH